MPHYPEVACCSDPQLDFIPRAYRFHTHLSSSVFKNGLIGVLLFKLGCLYVSFGVLSTSVRHYGHHLMVRECRWCLGHNFCLAAISVCRAHIPFQFLQCTGNIF